MTTLTDRERELVEAFEVFEQFLLELGHAYRQRKRTGGSGEDSHSDRVAEPWVDGLHKALRAYNPPKREEGTASEFVEKRVSGAFTGLDISACLNHLAKRIDDLEAK